MPLTMCTFNSRAQICCFLQQSNFSDIGALERTVLYLAKEYYWWHDCLWHGAVGSKWSSPKL